MLSRVDGLIGLDHSFLSQNHRQSRSGAIGISIRRKPVPAEVFASSARWNIVVQGLAEILCGEWLMQLRWMTPCDLVESSEPAPLLHIRSFCVVRCWHWTVQNRQNLRIQILQMTSPSACQEPIHRPRYDQSLFGADRHSWTLRLYILEYLVMIPIIQGLETVLMIHFLYFIEKRRE
jgi:hypothetical protein